VVSELDVPIVPELLLAAPVVLWPVVVCPLVALVEGDGVAVEEDEDDDGLVELVGVLELLCVLGVVDDVPVLELDGELEIVLVPVVLGVCVPLLCDDDVLLCACSSAAAKSAAAPQVIHFNEDFMVTFDGGFGRSPRACRAFLGPAIE
jgi:hypothetical protein